MSGCVDIDGVGFDPLEEDDDTADQTAADGNDVTGIDESRETLETYLEAAEVEINNLTANDEFSLDAQTEGDLDEDINRIASAYSSAAPELDRDLVVRIEDRGITEARFEIEHETALEHHNGEISDQDYLGQIHDQL